VTVKEWIETVVRGERASHALVIVGDRGSGKTVAVRALQTLLPTLQVNTMDASFVSPERYAETLARFATVTDIVVSDETHFAHQLSAIKVLLTSDVVDVDVLSVGVETRKVKANIIVTTSNFFPNEPANRHFVVTTPIAFIAQLLPFFAR
jgi:phage/plasmid-associated DNA primase